MELTEIAPGLHLLPLGISNAYLLHDGDGAALVDTGPPGSGPLIAAALDALGLRPQDLHSVVLTHFHDDHAGSAAEVASWSGAQVIAGRADAAYVRGDSAGPPPSFTEAEEALHAEVAQGLGPAPACRVDREVDEGDVLDLGGRAVVMSIPGHTPGSIALHLPDRGVLIAGDTVAEHQGTVILGPFNVDRGRAWASLQRLAALEVEVACFGHGRPVPSRASASLRSATDPLG